MMKILSVVGARPNFMKVAPLHRAFLKREIDSRIVHTGQHYDAKMSEVFFEQLGLPQPNHYLGVGGGTHTQQTARIMLKFEEILLEENPDLVLVVGDVNSTLACALVAVKMHYPVAHVEAGLRSGDLDMPEEINRILTDRISDYLFVTEYSGLVHLAEEGVARDKTFFTGNVMIDSLLHFREKASKTSVLQDLSLHPSDYVLMTMHRPSNVDREEGLRDILEIMRRIGVHKRLVFPMHPRTRNNFERFGLMAALRQMEQLLIIEPVGYLEFLQLMQHAFAILTDSGGIQEETTFLGVPCFTFRNSTERPVTVDLGTNVLLSDLSPDSVEKAFSRLLAGEVKAGVVPPLWDGHAAERIADILLEQPILSA